MHFYKIICCMLLLSACSKKTKEFFPIEKDVTEMVFASGVLEAKNCYNLTAQADGYLSTVNFEEGDVVIKGNVLAVVDNKQNIFNTESAKQLYSIAERNIDKTAPALQQAENNIALTKSKMEQDEVSWQRYKKLYNNNSIAKIDVENAELQYNTSKSNYANTLQQYKLLQQQAEQQIIINKTQNSINNEQQKFNSIVALVNGKVYKKYKSVGDYVKRGDVIALIGNANTIYAKVNIDESNIEKIQLQQTAYVQLNTNTNKTYKAIVAAIYPSFDEASQSFVCKLYFTEPIHFSIINTRVQANILVGINKSALLIPRNCIDFGGFVQLKNKKEKVKVTTQFISNEWVQVLSGITKNDVLITDNIPENKQTTSEVGAQMRR